MCKYRKMACMIGFVALAMASWGVSFERMNLNQEVDVTALNTMNSSISSTNGTTIIGVEASSNTNIQDNALRNNGITFDIQGDGTLRFKFDRWIDSRDPVDRILVNGVSLKSIMHEEIDRRSSLVSPTTITNILLGMTWNPLWGKKLAVIGDSLTVYPSWDKSYSKNIADRNNMVLYHRGVSGQYLCRDYTNAQGQVTSPSCLHSYTNNIPADADFILCQIGINDIATWRTDIQDHVADTNMDTTTFKGCWNNLVIGLKMNYPNAKIGMILPNNWPTNNLGFKSEDALKPYQEDEVIGMVRWQKIQCQKLNMAAFDPVEDTRMFTSDYKEFRVASPDDIDDWYERVKIDIGTSQLTYKGSYYQSQTPYLKDKIHPAEAGAALLSFYLEDWMKTVLMCQ